MEQFWGGNFFIVFPVGRIELLALLAFRGQEPGILNVLQCTG